MPKAHPIHDNGVCAGHVVECPACGHGHFFNNAHGSKKHPKGASWSFNGDVEKPTFTPSMLVRFPRKGQSEGICHSFVTDGQIRFLNDCTHELAGQTVELPEIER